MPYTENTFSGAALVASGWGSHPRGSENRRSGGSSNSGERREGSQARVLGAGGVVGAGQACGMSGGRLRACTLSLLLSSSKVGRILRQALSAPGLAAMSAVVIHNDTVLWTGNFGRKNGSDPASGPPNEYTMYRSAE